MPTVVGDSQPTKGADRWEGRVLADKYRLDQRVGEGAMGVVYRATQVLLEKTVAVKVMHTALTHDPAFAQRFELEARAASRLDHPNSVAVLDYGEEPDGLIYIVMEFLEGRTLADAIWAEAPFAPSRMLDVMSQALAALSAAHEAGIVHRDLKPENIMLVRRTDENGDAIEVAKVADFGIAKVMDRRGSGTAPKLTAQGLVTGTPEYMSPEQGSAQPVDGRSDLYSCGVILYEMVSGHVPFEADSALAIVLKHVSEAPRPFVDLNIACSPALSDVIFRALAKNPADRFPHARAMRSALRAAVLGDTAPPVHLSGLPPHPAPRTTEPTLLATEAVTPPLGTDAVAPPAVAPVTRRSSRILVFALVGASAFTASAFVAWKVHREVARGPSVMASRRSPPGPSVTVPSPSLPLTPPATAVRLPVATPPETLARLASSAPAMPDTAPVLRTHARPARAALSSPPIDPPPVVVAPGAPPPVPVAAPPVAIVAVAVQPAPVPPPAPSVSVPPPPPPLVPTPYRAEVRALSATNGVTRGTLQSRADHAASAFARCASRIARSSAEVTEASATLEVRDRRLDELHLVDAPSWLSGCTNAIRSGFEGDLPAGENTEYTVHLNVSLTPDR